MVATANQTQGSEIIARMRARFGEDLTRKDAALGVKSSLFVGGVTCKENGPTSVLITNWATTDWLDCDKEVLLPDGGDWNSYFMANGGQLFVDHCYGVSYRVGKARTMPSMRRTPTGGMGWLLTGVIRTDTENPNAKAVLEGARDGTIGMSIGFEALEYGAPTAEEMRRYPGCESIVRKYRVLEASYTYMPCNVQCQTMAVSMDEAKAAKVRDLWVKGVLPDSVRQRFMQPPEPIVRKVVVLGS